MLPCYLKLPIVLDWKVTFEVELLLCVGQTLFFRLSLPISDGAIHLLAVANDFVNVAFIISQWKKTLVFLFFYKVRK